jgi:hypothetical protein
MLTLTAFADNSLQCKVENKDDILKIKCMYKTIAEAFDRNISMTWKSPSTQQDDRFRTILLPANNKSTYDFRYFDGRADGSWSITATDDSTGVVTSTAFVKEELTKKEK